MAHMVDLKRIEELLGNPARLHPSEIGIILQMAKDRLLVLTDESSTIDTLQAGTDVWKERATQASKLLSDTQIALKQNISDAAIADNYIDILRRGLKDAVARERLFHNYNDRFVAGVHNCIDRTELPEEVKGNSTLLRLQEALDAKNDE